MSKLHLLSEKPEWNNRDDCSVAVLLIPKNSKKYPIVEAILDSVPSWDACDSSSFNIHEYKGWIDIPKIEEPLFIPPSPWKACTKEDGPIACGVHPDTGVLVLYMTGDMDAHDADCVELHNAEDHRRDWSFWIDMRTFDISWLDAIQED